MSQSHEDAFWRTYHAHSGVPKEPYVTVHVHVHEQAAPRGPQPPPVERWVKPGTRTEMWLGFAIMGGLCWLLWKAGVWLFT